MKLSFFKPIIISLITAVLSWAILLALFALILTKTENPSDFTKIGTYTALLLGSLIAGRISSYESENRFFHALIIGIFTALPLFLSSVILSNWGAHTFLMLVLCIIFVMAGFISKKPKTASHSSAKKRKMIARKYSA